MIAFFMIVLAGVFGLSHQTNWSYSYDSEWPGICSTGKKQSPINIIRRTALHDEQCAYIKGPLVFHGYRNVTVSASNNEHTLIWQTSEAYSAPVLSGGPLKGNYIFKEVHPHWLSEHAIDGRKFPLEFHMVHYKEGLTKAEAVLLDDGIVVIAVLCVVYGATAENDFALKELIPKVSNLIEEGQETELYNINVARLFSPEPQSYYTYNGSLTTPTCYESVVWLVMDKPLCISDIQYREFSKVNIGGVDNFRCLQSSNLTVYRSRST